MQLGKEIGKLTRELFTGFSQGARRCPAQRPWRSTTWEIHPIIKIEVLEEITTDEFGRRLNGFKRLRRDFEEYARPGLFALNKLCFSSAISAVR